MRLAAALALCSLLAGCTGAWGPPEPPGEGAWARDPCDPGLARPSGNAPVVPAMRGEPLDVARRFVEAFGDAWTTDAPADPSPGAWRWATREGEVRYSAASEPGQGAFTLSYTTPRGDAFTRASVEAALGRLGVALDGVEWSDEPHGGGNFVQTFEGAPLPPTWGGWLPGQGDPAPYGRWAGVTAPALRDLSRAEATLPAAEAARVAAAFDRCAMDAAGLDAEAGYVRQGEPEAGGFAVVDDSVARVVVLRYSEPVESHCGRVRHVAVDAVTGAALGLLPVPCD